MLLDFETDIAIANWPDACFGHEPDNAFVGYALKDSRVTNEVAYPPLGNYNGLQMQVTHRRLTTAPVTDYGVKTFPKFGAFGYFTTFYDGVSKVLVPINPKNQSTAKPSVVTSRSGANVTFTITATDPYECYRIIARQGFTAVEIVSYDTVATLSIPYTGLVDLTVIGHKEETAVASLPWEGQITM